MSRLPKNLEIEMEIYPLSGTGGLEKYNLKVTRNGFFVFFIEKDYRYKVNFFISSYIHHRYIKSGLFLNYDMMQITFDADKFVIRFPKGLIITDLIEIYSPLPGSRFQKDEDIIFYWEDEPFADFYTLNIYCIEEDGTEIKLLTVSNLRQTHITLNEIKAIPEYDSSIHYYGSKDLYRIDYEFGETGYFDIEIDGVYFDNNLNEYHRLNNYQILGRNQFYLE